MSRRRFLPAILAEAIGTFVLVFFGVGSVHAAILTGGQGGLWQVAIVWGLAIALAIYATGAVSGCHINPAITIAFAVHRRFAWRKVPAYLAAQLIGAFLAAGVLYALNRGFILHLEAAEGLVRGGPGSERVAMIFGQYFPNPAMAHARGWRPEVVAWWQATLAEGIGTAVLAFFVAAVTDGRNRGGPGTTLLPIAIGLTVSILIMVIAPLTQGGFNPARDFAPRCFAWLAGWGEVAIPGPRGGCLTVYILAPILGATAGVAAYRLLLHRFLPSPSPATAPGTGTA